MKFAAKRNSEKSLYMTIEFFLNDFRWIHWKMSKSKSGMVTRDTPCLITDTFLEVIAKIKSYWLTFDWAE